MPARDEETISTLFPRYLSMSREYISHLPLTTSKFYPFSASKFLFHIFPYKRHATCGNSLPELLNKFYNEREKMAGITWSFVMHPSFHSFVRHMPITTLLYVVIFMLVFDNYTNYLIKM